MPPGVDEYSITASSNTTLNSIPVSDSTLPNQVDNLVRQLMADIRRVLNDIGAKAVSSGTDTITLTTETVLATAYADGTLLIFIAGGTNTGAATLNVDSVGAKAVVKAGGTALTAGDITAGMAVAVVYDASQGSGSWMLLNPNLGSYQPLDADLTTLASAFTTASGSAAASLKFAEDTDNGSNAVTLIGPASTADVTVTLPAATDTLVGKATTDTLTNKTLTSPVIDTGVSGTAILDEDNMASDSATQLATQQSIKAYVDAAVAGAGTAEIATGSYTGDGGTSQAITAVGFTPKYVKIWFRSATAGTNAAIWETTAEILDDDASGMSMMHSSTGAHTLDDDAIITLGADGFTVDDNGADSDPNKNGQAYNFMCIG